MITMLLGGLWHGASWNFIVWGGLHGLYLIINHSWRRLWRYPHVSSVPYAATSWMITMIAVGLAWVFFRSPSLAHSGAVLWGLAGQAGLGGQSIQTLLNLPVQTHDLSWAAQIWVLASIVQSKAFILIVAWLIACTLPNSQTIIDGDREKDSRKRTIRWRPNAIWAAGLALLTLISLTNLTVVREFAYFQF
jgi:D-alanyl-lipoteichoic acid acyltransferase DltB (MBOAT superfamily)